MRQGFDTTNNIPIYTFTDSMTTENVSLSCARIKKVADLTTNIHGYQIYTIRHTPWVQTFLLQRKGKETKQSNNFIHFKWKKSLLDNFFL